MLNILGFEGLGGKNATSVMDRIHRDAGADIKY